jgi:hypothetical protein
MAEISLSSGSICRPFRSPWGAFPIRHMPLSTGVSSLAIRLGQQVRLDDRTSTCGHRIMAAITTGETLLVGIAAEGTIAGSGSTSTVDTEIPVWEANPMVEFVANTKGGALVSTIVGSARSLAWDSTLNICYVDVGASTGADNRVVVTELIDNIGDTGGRVAFRFMGQDRASTNNSSVAYLGLYGR